MTAAGSPRGLVTDRGKVIDQRDGDLLMVMPQHEEMSRKVVGSNPLLRKHFHLTKSPEK